MFSAISMVVALLVMLLIGSAIFAVVLGGVAYLPAAIASQEIRFSIRTSLSTAFLSTALCMLLAVPSAYAFTRTSMPFKRAGEVLLELTMCLPYIVLGLCLLIVFSSSFGKWLKSVGFRVVFDKRGIVIAQLFVNLPFALRMVRTAFMQVDSRLERIAEMLGASKWKQLITITLPLCKNALVGTVVLTWSRAMGEFGATLMLVGVTRMKTETLPGSIYLSIATGDNNMAMAAAALMLFIACLTLVVTNRLNKPPRYYRIGGGR
ncbi:MAG: ABC transporter permease subunit [Candidatus Pelethousia sp.]|nr:ABC transporter permease subunit [Candidatus Pelethousia sp.]